MVTPIESEFLYVLLVTHVRISGVLKQSLQKHFFVISEPSEITGVQFEELFLLTTFYFLHHFISPCIPYSCVVRDETL